MKKVFLALLLAAGGSLSQAAVTPVDLNHDGSFNAFLDEAHGLLWTNGNAFAQFGLNYEDALTAVSNSTIEGVTTWRLPTMAEFGDLYDTQGTQYLNPSQTVGVMIRTPFTLWGTSYATTTPYVTADPRYQNHHQAFVANQLWTSQSSHFSETTKLGVWAVTAVPEPETYAMLLVGLGLIGSIARQRKNKRV